MATSPHLPAPRAVAVCIDTRDGAGRKRLHGVSEYARRLGWRMMLVRQGGSAAAREVLRLRPDGIIAYVADKPLLAAAHQLNVPLVDTALGDIRVPFAITLDNEAVGRLAGQHLLNAGLKNFGYCGVNRRLASQVREASLEKFLAQHGFALHRFAQQVTEGESRLEPLMKWLRRLPQPLGLLAFDDKLGERVLTACHWAGLAVPDQVAVLGVGNDELMCEVAWPSLSSVSFPTQRLGYEAAEMLNLALQGRPVKPPLRQIQPAGIVARGSTDTLSLHDDFTQAVLRLVRQRYGETVGVDQIADELKVSRRTLERRFLAALGRTVHDELVRLRLQKAQDLLSGGSHAINHVAHACGYSTPASFSRAFRQLTGRWPSEYRNETRVI